MKTVLILYPHQLFPIQQLPTVDRIYLVEDPLFFGVDSQYPIQLHKQKLILHRASMRRYVAEVLWPANQEVEYVELDPLFTTGDILSRLGDAETVYIFDPVDDVLTKRLLTARRENTPSLHIEFLDSPNFYLSEPELKSHLSGSHKMNMASFYQWQRERFNILIDDDYKPVGGKWSFDTENRQKLPKDHILPSFEVFGDHEEVQKAKNWANDHFANNPGSDDFIWPTSHGEAQQWLDDFMQHRIDDFGTYQDAIDATAPWIHHSILSSSLNIGLLEPQQIIQAALRRHAKKPVPLASLEGFIRQIIGWREYVRGAYITKGTLLRKSNGLKNERKLTDDWYSGNLGIPPFDDVAKKLQQHAYAHHIERLMIVGNLMLLCEVHPDEVYKYLSTFCIDAYDWVMVPNVYVMSQFTAENEITTKPYISSSNYIMKMSNYQKGEWSDTWDGLFWRFIEKNKTLIEKNPRMRMMITQLDKIDHDRRRIISYRAEDFLNQYTRS
jgi:deoxyribodipyrimidine photolyase-related protein